MSTTTQTQWTLDTAHSEIGFKVRHLVITNVSEKFDSFEGIVSTSSDDFADAQINFSADINSINTGNEQRDGHLKSDDFFNAEQFPKLTFTSTAFKKVSGEQYKLEGHMTIRDITKPVTLDVEFGGTIVDPWGNLKAGFEINGKINRKDFNLKWDALTETGGAVVSDEVKLHLHIELQKTA
jgi:polyisoprenoid-binding protein YceI